MSRVSVIINSGLAPLRRYRPELIALSALSILLCGTGCQPRITTHGFMPRTDLIERLDPGEQNKNQIAAILLIAKGHFDRCPNVPLPYCRCDIRITD